jgi:hypothetical protein
MIDDRREICGTPFSVEYRITSAEESRPLMEVILYREGSILTVKNFHSGKELLDAFYHPGVYFPEFKDKE